MKTKIFIILLFLSTSVFASDVGERLMENDSEFFYIQCDAAMNLNISNGVYSPFLGIGTRQIYGKNSFDWNISIEPYILLKSKFKLVSYSLNANYLRFCKSKNKNKYYFGAGASIQGIYTPDFLYVLRSPTFILGKQIYEGNKVFIVQLKINWPNWPCIWIKDFYFNIPSNEMNKRMWTPNVFVTTAVGF